MQRINRPNTVTAFASSAFTFVIFLTAHCTDISPAPGNPSGNNDASLDDARTDFDSGIQSDAGILGEGSVSSDGGRSVDAGLRTDSGGTDGGGAMCRGAREQLLRPVDKVSSGVVSELGTVRGVTTLYVDASAGGPPAASMNARVYLDLSGKKRADITDTDAETSTDWDVALKRPVLFTNSGDGGPGRGGALFIPGKAIDDVTLADTLGQTFLTESFFDEVCNPKLDQTNAVKTSFDGWYQYSPATNTLTPTLGTWAVRSASGALFRLQITEYYANPDGTKGSTGGRYVIKIGALL
jgi:HmuY protein